MVIQIRPRPHARESGFIMVAVLWILVALATLAAIFAVYLRETAASLVEYDERLEAQALTTAGVELAAYQLTATSREPPSVGRLRFNTGSARVTVDYQSENGRVDLNYAPKELLIGLFVGLGASREDAQGYADRIVVWRTPANAATGNEDAANYQSDGRGYSPRRGAFQHANEVALVRGIPAEMIGRALPHLTVYGGQAEINAFSASSEVLGALPGLTSERIRILLSQRQGASQDVLTAQLGMGAQYVTGQPSRTYRILVSVQLGPTKVHQSETVIRLIDAGADPYRVLSWRETFGD